MLTQEEQEELDSILAEGDKIDGYFKEPDFEHKDRMEYLQNKK